MEKNMELPASKPLGHDDESGFSFSQEMLGGDATAAVNFDRLQKHPVEGYILFEYLLCDESQAVTPYTSHPRNYWNKNKSKFLGLWRTAKSLDATLYLVNYAKAGTRHADKVLVIKVLGMDETGITHESAAKITRARFSSWFRKLNRECMASPHEIMFDTKYDLFHMEKDAIGDLKPDFGKYRGLQIRDIAKIPDHQEYAYILRCYESKQTS